MPFETRTVSLLQEVRAQVNQLPEIATRLEELGQRMAELKKRSSSSGPVGHDRLGKPVWRLCAHLQAFS
jgi:hypothetical protein